MSPARDTERYFCPMHADIREPGPAKCPQCGMDLVTEDERLPILKGAAGTRWVLALAAIVALAVMLAVMAVGR